MKRNTKQERLEAVNQLMKEIGSRSHRSFYNATHNRYAEMVIENHRIYFVDDYTGKKVYAYNTVQNNRKGFSHGGTFWALVNDFREFIATGTCTDGNNGYGGLYCPHWGYPKEDMIAIRKLALQVGYLKGN